MLNRMKFLVRVMRSLQDVVTFVDKLIWRGNPKYVLVLFVYFLLSCQLDANLDYTILQVNW